MTKSVPSKIIIQSHNIVLAKIVTGLGLDKDECFFGVGVFDAVGVFAGDVDGISRIY